MNLGESFLIKKIGDDQKVAWAVAIVIFSTPIVTFINAVTNLIYPNIIDTIIFYCAEGLIVLSALPVIVKRLKAYDFIGIMIIVAIYLSNFLFFPGNFTKLVEIAVRFFLFVLPCYLLGRAVTDVQSIMSLVRTVAAVTIVCSVLTQVVWFYSGYVQADDMSFSYYVLPSTLFFISQLFQKKNLKNIVLSMSGVFVLILAGTRGPLVCVMAFVGYSIMIKMKKAKDYFLLISVLATGVYLWISNFYINLLTALNNLLLSAGLNNRILYTLINGEFIESRERDMLIEKTIAYTNSAGFFGRGIGSERVILGEYAHNLIYEIWCHFGYFIGSIALMLILVILLKGFIKNNSQIERCFFGILLCSSVVKLFMSSSYLNEPILWLLFGYCISAGISKKAQPGLGKKDVQLVYCNTFLHNS
jgi:hypothetical protein